MSSGQVGLPNLAGFTGPDAQRIRQTFLAVDAENRELASENELLRQRVALLEANIQVNGTYFARRTPYRALNKNSNQSLPDGTWTVVEGWSARHSSPTASTTPYSGGELSLVVPGIYLVSTTLQFAGNVNGRRVLGFSVDGASAGQTGRFELEPQTSSTKVVTTATTIESEGDTTVRVMAYQDSGSTLDIVGGFVGNNFSVTWQGPL